MAYNSSYTGTQIDEAIDRGEWYNLRSIAAGKGVLTPRQVVIENYIPQLTDTEQYRLVLMHERRKSGKGLVWSCPMFGAMNASDGSMVMAETYKAVAGRMTEVSFSPTMWVPLVTGSRICARFLGTSNTRKRVGYALFKHTGVGNYGWQRVSNIVGVCAALGNKQLNTGMNFSAFSE